MDANTLNAAGVLLMHATAAYGPHGLAQAISAVLVQNNPGADQIKPSLAATFADSSTPWGDHFGQLAEKHPGFALDMVIAWERSSGTDCARERAILTNATQAATKAAKCTP